VAGYARCPDCGPGETLQGGRAIRGHRRLRVRHDSHLRAPAIPRYRCASSLASACIGRHLCRRRSGDHRSAPGWTVTDANKAQATHRRDIVTVAEAAPRVRSSANPRAQESGQHTSRSCHQIWPGRFCPVSRPRCPIPQDADRYCVPGLCRNRTDSNQAPCSAERLETITPGPDLHLLSSGGRI
jgi:hypothetical protein